MGDDVLEDDLAAQDAFADSLKICACRKPRPPEIIVDQFKLKNGSPEDVLSSRMFRKQGVDAFARTVIVGSPEKPLVWSWLAIEVCGV